MSKEKPSRPENNQEAPVDATNPTKRSPGAEVTRLRTIWNSILARFSKRQILFALGIAAISDLLCAFLVFAPPFVWGIDLATALLLFAVLGWHWMFLPGLVMEAIPGFGIFPFWLLVVVAIFVLGTPRPKLRDKP